jgi:hypothetical protein
MATMRAGGDGCAEYVTGERFDPAFAATGSQPEVAT